MARPRSLGAKLMDGLWVRIVDVAAALAARSFNDGRVTLEVVSDPLFEDNVGTWTISGGKGHATMPRLPGCGVMFEGGGLARPSPPPRQSAGEAGGAWSDLDVP